MNQDDPPVDPTRRILQALIGVLIVFLVCGAIFIVVKVSPFVKVISQESTNSQYADPQH